MERNELLKQTLILALEYLMIGNLEKARICIDVYLK